jgi:hypothetical protein
MKSDRFNAPAQPFLGTKRILVQYAVAAAILAIFLFVTWATMAGG